MRKNAAMDNHKIGEKFTASFRIFSGIGPRGPATYSSTNARASLGKYGEGPVMPSNSGPNGDPECTAVQIMSGSMNTAGAAAIHTIDFHPSRVAEISTIASASGRKKILVDENAAARIPMLTATRPAPATSARSFRT